MTSTTKIPHGLYLVGCGPGDPELLTSAADSVLKSADVLICDSLIYESFKKRKGEIEPVHISEKIMLADPFTKYLVHAVWAAHMQQLRNQT